MLKLDGDKLKMTIVMDKRLQEFVERKAAKIGLNKSAYIRMLVANEAEKEERREREG